MKSVQNELIVLLVIALSFPYLGASQDSLDFELKYEVNRIHPYISISKEKLKDAQTLIDLDRHYRSSWIREYISVEILTSTKGKIRRAVSQNDTLSQEQKDNMNMADVGTDISVRVKYMPENTLTHNDIKEIDFTFIFEPEVEARYPGGQQQLKGYLKENAMDKISVASFKKYNLTAIKFSINEEGQVVDTHVFESSKDEKVDELLVETIRNMPNWKPAVYANGIKVKQEFVLTAGDMSSCVINLLNIHEGGLAKK